MSTLSEADRIMRAHDEGYQAGIRKALELAKSAWGGPAHTYASENADIYRAGDDMARRIIASLKAYLGD